METRPSYAAATGKPCVPSLSRRAPGALGDKLLARGRGGWGEALHAPSTYPVRNRTSSPSE